MVTNELLFCLILVTTSRGDSRKQVYRALDVAIKAVKRFRVNFYTTIRVEYPLLINMVRTEDAKQT